MSRDQRRTAAVRIAVAGALVIALVAVLVVLLTGNDPYTVKARFASASQLVKGNLVQVAGGKVGTVEEIELTDDGRALVTFTVEKPYAPLRDGTRATIRQQSLSGIANRYIDLQLGGATGSELASGATIQTFDTASTVDLDQFLSTFDPMARVAVQKDIRFLGELVEGRTKEANEAVKYLDPALAASSRLFAELNRDRPALERFIVETAGLVGTLADNEGDVRGLIKNLATTSSALADRKAELGEAIGRLPDFMRKTNTTFLNLRAALDDLDPLVEESMPVVRRLRPFTADLRPFAQDAVPALADLSAAIRREGRDNDLVELLRLQPRLERTANDPLTVNGERREGALPALRRAFRGNTPQLAFGRPYTPDLLGWFDDFSTSGQYDALGGFSRAGLSLNPQTFAPILAALPLSQAQKESLAPNVDGGRNSRCPGSSERNVDGSNPYRPSPDFNCDPSIMPIGP